MLFSGILDGNRIDGEVLIFMGNDNAVHNGHGDCIVVGRLVRHRGKGQTVGSVFVYEQIDSVRGLLTRVKRFLAGRTGIGGVGLGIVESYVDRLDETGGEGGCIVKGDGVVIGDLCAGCGRMDRYGLYLEFTAGRSLERGDCHVEEAGLACGDFRTFRYCQFHCPGCSCSGRKDWFVSGQVNRECAGDGGGGREIDFLYNDGAGGRILDLEFSCRQDILHLQAQFYVTCHPRLLAEHRELLSGEMGLVVVPGLDLYRRESQVDLLGRYIL